ncbi:universal stress protein [Chloroflexota bacterium]
MYLTNILTQFLESDIIPIMIMNTDSQKFKKVLLPLDGSIFSEIATIYAANLVKNQNVELILLSVLITESRKNPEEELYYLDKRIDVINATLKAQKESGGTKPIIKRELIIGKPANEILNYKRDYNIDLIIMATRGRSGVTKLIMGSVASKVVSASGIPVLLVKTKKGETKLEDQATDVTRRVIIPLDGSKLSESTISIAQEFVSQFGDKQSEIILLSVFEPSPVQSGHSPLMMSDGQKAAGIKSYEHALKIQEYLSNLKETIRCKDINITINTVVGNPAEKIIEQSLDKKATLIAMSTHGRSGMTRIAYGSVAEAVIYKSQIPILLIKPTE